MDQIAFTPARLGAIPVELPRRPARGKRPLRAYSRRKQHLQLPHCGLSAGEDQIPIAVDKTPEPIAANGLQRAISQSLTTATNLFPLWVAGGAVAAVARPSLFLWFRPSAIAPTLALIQLGMGLTLTVPDFVAVLRHPRVVVTAALAQFSIMPLLGLLISRTVLNHPTVPVAFRVGLCLVAACPGGAASNLVCYLGGANVPLSILMTLTTTTASVIATPFLMYALAGTLVPVNAAGLLLSTAQVVIAPLALGVGLNRLFPNAVRRLSTLLPLVSVAGVVLICSSIVAANAARAVGIGLRLLTALIALHAGGFLLGYCVGGVAVKGGRQSARTLSIEVGMQNSGLGAALAQAHFADPLTAVPCAISATLHSVMGSVLAGVWSWSDARKRGRVDNDGSRTSE